MAKKQAIEVEASVKEALPNGMFRVELPNDHEVLAHVSGKIRMHFIRVLPGDRIIALSSGGGGYGDPQDRDEESQAWDEKNGYATK